MLKQKLKQGVLNQKLQSQDFMCGRAQERAHVLGGCGFVGPLGAWASLTPLWASTQSALPLRSPVKGSGMWEPQVVPSLLAPASLCPLRPHRYFSSLCTQYQIPT